MSLNEIGHCINVHVKIRRNPRAEAMAILSKKPRRLVRRMSMSQDVGYVPATIMKRRVSMPTFSMTERLVIV